MKPKNKTPLTSLDLCILLAHEAAALLNADAEAVDSAIQLQEGLRIIAAANELENEASPLLAWIDWEVESAKRFIAGGEDTPSLIDPERLLLVPGAATQLDAVWMFFQTSLELQRDQRHILFNAARMLTEMGGLEDMLLRTNIPAAGLLTAESLRTELEDVRTALQSQEAQSVEMAAQV